MEAADRETGQRVAGEEEEEGMLTITITVDAPLGQAQAIKEALAMECERWGDTRIAEVRETVPEQMRITETN